MSKVIAGMTMSLDGFVADRDGNVGQLYSDLSSLQGSDYLNAMAEETGAVLMGRRTYDMAGDPDSYADSYEFQCPIVVLTHHPPAVAPRSNDRLTITFVTDGLGAALDRAIEAARDKAVTVVGGIEVIRKLLRAGEVDELRIDLMPVFLGEGSRLFDDPALALVTIEAIGSQQAGPRTCLRYRVA